MKNSQTNDAKPRLFTFDIFGTVIDWLTGLRRALREHGRRLKDGDLDRVIDLQGAYESGPYRSYAEIAAQSFTADLGLAPAEAQAIASRLGEWPLYPDAKRGLSRLRKIAPCVAMTNSDVAHGRQVQNQLGFSLSDWACSEEVRVYKPSPRFWRAVSERRTIPLGRHWWHVSAYADYDLKTAAELGLTCVFIPRPHSRPGPAHITVPDIDALADLAEKA